MFENMDTPKIYVACLAAYNAGRLHGKWIDADQDADEILREINAMLAVSPETNAEESAIHDYEGFGGLHLGEHERIKRVSELAVFIAENTRFGCELLCHFDGDLQEAREALENYLGEYKSLSLYAQDLTEETTEIPKHLEFYIDYEAMARDMEINGDVFAIETDFEVVHVFLSI